MERGAAEIIAIRSLRGLRTLTAILVSDCNLRCAYCFQNAKRPARMTWAVLRQALRPLLASTRRSVDVVFTGGEPLLAFSLIRRATRYIEAQTPPGRTVRLNLITNGTLLDRRVARFLAEHRFSVQLSLDGVPGAQSLRGEETCALLNTLLDRLRHDHPAWFRRRMSVNLTVLPRTIPFLSDSVEYLIAKDVRDISLTPVLGHDLAWRSEHVRDLEDQFGRLVRSSRRHFRQTGRVPVRVLRRRSLPRNPSALPSRLCGVGRPDYLAVDVDGEVSGCVLLARSYQQFPDTRLGRGLAALQRARIGSRDLVGQLSRSAHGLEALGVFDNRSRKHSSYGRCATCRYAAECDVCPLAIVWQPRNTDPDRIPDFDCAFNRVVARHRHRFPIVP
jgi:sulfatase maturation enzyme AslB (radical SAM superfamily)